MKKLILLLAISLFSITGVFAQYTVTVRWNADNCNCNTATDSVFKVQLTIADIANNVPDVIDLNGSANGTANSKDFDVSYIESYCADTSLTYTPSFMIYAGIQMECNFPPKIVICKGKDSFGPYSCLDFAQNDITLSYITLQ